MYKLLFFVILLQGLFSCNAPLVKEASEKTDTKLFLPYRDSMIVVKTNSLNPWSGNLLMGVNAAIKNMKIVFDFDLAEAYKELYNLSVKNNFDDIELNFEFTFNGEKVIKELQEIKKEKNSGTMYSSFDDSTGVFFEKIYLQGNRPVRIIIPLYILRRFKANTKILVNVRIWQDYFLCDKKSTLANGTQKYFVDTLVKKLIDNSYSFSLSVPPINMSEIICDSIVLQNDKDWNPAGSDNTIFKSSYPDIFYSIIDYSNFEQSSSHIEKSTSKFTQGDTLLFYYYKKNEPFYLEVRDFDFLSRNDLLGDTVLNQELMPENKTLILKFRHVNCFYLRKKTRGKIN